MSLQKKSYLFFLRCKNSVLGKQISGILRNNSLAIFSGLLIINFIGMSVLFLNISRQNSLVIQQTEALAQVTNLREKVEVANQQAETNSSTLQQLKDTVSQLSKGVIPIPSKVLGTTASSNAELASADLNSSGKTTPLGIIQVNLKSNDKPVFDDQTGTTQIDTAAPGTVMLFYKKEAGWYQVDPPTKYGELGWVQQDNVTEMPNVTELPH